MSEFDDKWETTVSQTVHTILRHGWTIKFVRRNERATYVIQARREGWLLEYVASPELTDEGALVDAATKDLIRFKDVRTVAAMSDATLAKMWQDAVNDGRIVYDTVTSEISTLAKRAPYPSAWVRRELPGLDPKTLEALAVAGIVSIGDLELRSDQQLMGMKGFGMGELLDLRIQLNKLLKESE